MQDHIKFLVVEDRPDWSQSLVAEVRDYFTEVRELAKQRVRPGTAYDGDQANQLLRDQAFDLVTLDMNLSERATSSKISGLDVLAQIARSNSAYFVLIITGAVNDPDLEKLYGSDAAALMRYGALNEAVKLLPAERVRILNKPSDAEAAPAVFKIRNQLHSALDQYCAVSRERNIFRPDPRFSGKGRGPWEIRYNGGERLTLPHINGYDMIRSALAQPNREMKVIQLIQKLAQSSGKMGAVTMGEHTSTRKSPRTAEPKAEVDAGEYDGFNLTDNAPVDADEGTIPIETLIRGLLSTRSNGGDLARLMDEIVRKMNIDGRIFLAIPAKIWEFTKDAGDAECEFGERAVPRLKELLEELQPLLGKYRTKTPEGGAAANTGGKRTGQSGKKTRVNLGKDTKEMKLARKHWERVGIALRKYPSLTGFVEHIESCVERGITAKGHIHYRPAAHGEFTPYWVTE